MADQARFLGDVARHQLQVIHAHGVHRHLRFKEPGRSEYWFDLVTWPGTLCIHGDCGSYVFSRIEDMFAFFRSRAGEINPSYWAEKCDAACTRDGIRQFDPAKFTTAVVSRFRDDWRDGDRAERRECFKELREEVLDRLDGAHEHDAFSLLGSFSYGQFRFEDYWEIGAKKYTFRFLWCLRAIIWGIQRFDELRQRERAVFEEVAGG